MKSKNMPLNSISPLDGRYFKKIRNLYNLSDSDFKHIKKIETTTNHDVKAVEYFIKEKLSKTSLEDSLEWIHFGLTSEDTNNIAYGLTLSKATANILVPKLKEVNHELELLAKHYRNLPMLARTHGQPASPTTFGKEMGVFAHRLGRGLDHLSGQKILVKLNGASGNYNAHIAAFPKFDWLKFSKKFISGFNKKLIFKLEINPFTTQIEPHDSYIELFDRFKRFNNMLMDLNQDMWRYISDDWITQKPKKGEVGSSAMTHKVNPIDFENSEGNLGIANALLEHMAAKLPISRWQRDLSDSTVLRNIGVAMGHAYLAYQSIRQGLAKIAPNQTVIASDLDAHWEVLAEPIQTMMRRFQLNEPYEQLKAFTRGKPVDKETLRLFVSALSLPNEAKTRLLELTPEDY